MNHPSSGLLLLSKAIPGFIHFKTAEGLSDRTIASHEYILQKWLTYQGDKDVAAITSQEIIAYLSWLRTDYTPKRFNGKTPIPYPQKRYAISGLGFRRSTPGHPKSCTSLTR